jgi:hypothetical protein
MATPPHCIPQGFQMTMMSLKLMRSLVPQPHQRGGMHIECYIWQPATALSKISAQVAWPSALKITRYLENATYTGL